ncbi:MAG: type II secretion system protein GspG [Planctomycetes bacterium]|nr:type II secretion system protein GspG [Planctomycetota bacterium]
MLDGLDTAKEEPNEEKLTEIGNTLGQIKIVGVRAKPDGLTAALEQASGIDRQILGQLLAQKGFFLGRGGKLWSNEGDLLFETKKGVRYTLRFGELARDDGSEVSGIGSEPKEGEQPAEEANNRYLMVTAEFAESLLKKPTGPRLEQAELDKRAEARKQVEAIQKAVEAWRASHENQLPANLLALTEKPAEGEALLAELAPDPWGGEYQLTAEGDGYVVSSFGADKAAGGDGANADVRSDRLPFEDELSKFAGEWTSYDAKVKTGQEEAGKLTARFGPWYYVIDKTLFDKLKPKRADLVKPKAADDAASPGGVQPGGGDK